MKLQKIAAGARAFSLPPFLEKALESRLSKADFKNNSAKPEEVQLNCAKRCTIFPVKKS